MEELHISNRLVDISEPILAEDSTFNRQALTIKAVLEQLDETANHNDYLVALILVLLAESGFYVSLTHDIPECRRRRKIVHIPSDWKQPETEIYEINLILYDLEQTRARLVAVALNYSLVLNLFGCMECIICYSMLINPLKYVNPYTSHNYMRYMNIKELSHSFKDTLVTPMRADILLALGKTGPGFQCLPKEIRSKIADMQRRLEARKRKGTIHHSENNNPKIVRLNISIGIIHQENNITVSVSPSAQ